MTIQLKSSIKNLKFKLINNEHTFFVNINMIEKSNLYLIKNYAEIIDKRDALVFRINFFNANLINDFMWTK